MLVLGILSLLLRYTCAQNLVAGVGRLNGGGEQDVNFSLPVFADTVEAIVSSLDQGPNRTTPSSIPVNKVYGVNLGNWFVSEPWMTPSTWEAMGGELCDDCSTCRQSEWSLTKYLGQNQANTVFKQHWETWITQADIDAMVEAGMNTVRVPLGYWLVEDLVDRSTEFYAEGGLDVLITKLAMLRDAGINVILDHHALPGVAASEQMFAGNCTTYVEFYTSPDDYNYKRAVTWSVVMAWLSHVHPSFASVFAIEAVNEPLQNATLTPGLDRFEKAFVLGIRAIEFTLGIICDDAFAAGVLSDSIALPAFESALPIIAQLALKYGIGILTDVSGVLSNGKLGAGALLLGSLQQRRCLSTTFMDKDWQYTGDPANPSDYAHGPQVYDNHLYFNYGGVAPQATPESYMETLCQITRIGDEESIGDAPLITGEWSLATAFDSNSSFLQQWSDAQKLVYSQGAGWIFWAWKVDPTIDQGTQWSYQAALAANAMTKDPSAVFDPNVCVPYM